ncbi:MAG: hypothetical protein QM725_11060 [Lacibacter sp.]
MKTKRPLTPAFINQLDEYLLLNSPVTWTARTHLVVYYAILFSAVLTVLSFIVPADPRNDSTVFVWVSLTAVLSAIGFIVWCIFLFRFNVFKRFGEDKPFDALKTFLLFFISVLFMIAPCYIPPAVESIRANAAFGNEELVNDLNAINTKICQLEYDSLEHNWYASKYIVRDTLTDRYYDQDDETIERSSQNKEYKIIDTASFRYKKENADSVVKINDSTWHFYTCPSYIFLSDYNTDRYTKAKALGSISLFNLVIRKYQKHDLTKTKNELNELLKKYSTEKFNYSYYSDLVTAVDRNRNYHDKIEEKYNLSHIGNSFSNLREKKYRWYTNNDSRIRLLLYLSVIFTLLVFIFRHSTVKTFFLTLLTGIILLVLSGLSLAFLRFQDTGMYNMILFYFIVFLVIAATTFSRKIRYTVDGIAINMITFFTVFIPLFITLLYYEIDQKKYHLGLEYPPGYHEQKETYLLIAEIAGFVLLFVLIEPFFKKLYRNWFSKPEQ